MNTAHADLPINMRPLRTDEVARAGLAAKLGQMGARFQHQRGDGSQIYLAGSGHKLRVVARTATIIAIEIYPAGCSC